MACCSVIPLISTVFRRLDHPAVILTDDFGIFSVLLRNAIRASLAAPSTGDAPTRSLILPPWIPAMLVLEAPGWMWR